MMDKQSLKPTLDKLELRRPEIKEITRLMTDHCTLRKHPHTMRIFKNDPLCRLRNEWSEAISHTIFNSKAFTRWRYTIFGYFGLEERLPKKPDKIAAVPSYGDQTICL